MNNETDSIDDILNELSTETTPIVVEAIEPANDDVVMEVAEHTEDDMNQVIGEIEATEMREAAYAGQESNIEVSDETPAPKRKGHKKANKVVSEDGSPPAPKRINTADMKASDALIHKIGTDPEAYVFDTDDMALTDMVAHRETFFSEANLLAKKVKEKLVNLMLWAHKDDGLSVYTSMALDVLLKDGVVKTSTLKQVYQKAGYSEGTAASQAGQMCQLFVAAKIAKTGPDGFAKNPNSTLLAAYESHFAAVKKAA